jgi:mannose-1-phosphate guanylyltransferase / mannose-6-phosphate isomerase
MILSGGSGTRLWPLSREAKPKQFLHFGSERSLMQETVLRCRGGNFDLRPIIVAAEAHRFMVAEDLGAIGVSADIVLEPMRRDSCAAIIAGALAAEARDPNALVLMLAADHHIPDVAGFAVAVAASKPQAEAGRIVTFGMKPKTPATGYGYILPEQPLTIGEVGAVAQFVEKPDLATAQRYLLQGYLWNSGNFLFRASVLLAEAGTFAPAVVAAVRAAFKNAHRDLNFLKLDAEAFSGSPQISVDFAVMEKTARASVIAVDYAWNDIGSWDAVRPMLAEDGDGNVSTGKAVVLQGRNNLVHSEHILTSLLGVDDLVVVTTRDAVLITAKGRTEQVKALVSEVQSHGYPEANETLEVYRPWGHHERLEADEHYQVRRIEVRPGGTLARQKHLHRAEHWIVVSGEATVERDGVQALVKANESAFVAAGVLHQLSNRGKLPLILIEVQTGESLSEDDKIIT